MADSTIPWRNNDLICSFFGWEAYQVCPKGIIMKKGDSFFLNGKEKIYQGPEWGWTAHRDGLLIAPHKNGSILLNGTRVVYQGPFDFFEPHPQGVLIEHEGKILLNGNQLIYQFENKDPILDWYSDPMTGTFVLQVKDKLFHNGTTLLCECEGLDWQPCAEGVIIRDGNQLLLNGQQVLYQGELGNSWSWYPAGGVIIRMEDKWYYRKM